MRAFGCVQADVSLLPLGVPARVEIGVYGGIGYNLGDKCFSWHVDLALGLFFEVKVAGVGLGVSVNLVGTLNSRSSPTPPASKMRLGGHQGRGRRGLRCEAGFGPQGGPCPGGIRRRPFQLWSSFFRKIYDGISQDESIKKRVAAMYDEVRKSEAYTAYSHYGAGQVPAQQPENAARCGSGRLRRYRDGGKTQPKVYGDVGVAETFLALDSAYDAMEDKFARLSASALKRLTDNSTRPALTVAAQPRVTT